MIIDNDFAVFILAHEKPECVLTLKALRKYGYTKDNWFIVLDDKDRCIDEYIKAFGKEKVVLFSKDEVLKKFDIMDNSGDDRCVVFARNACFELAKKLGFQYFIELDDDYKEFEYRFADDDKLRMCFPTNLDAMFEICLEYFSDTKNVTCMALAQTGDFLGGLNGGKYKKKFLRKAMNSFICDVDRPFTFNGRINEDVNTYCLEGSRGKVFCTTTDVCINQQDTQQKSGGMTGIYGDGTYKKSFYTVMCCPSFVKVAVMNSLHPRIHHRVNWNNAVPKIVSSRFTRW